MPKSNSFSLDTVYPPTNEPNLNLDLDLDPTTNDNLCEDVWKRLIKRIILEKEL
jgi:hypothetical protein